MKSPVEGSLNDVCMHVCMFILKHFQVVISVIFETKSDIVRDLKESPSFFTGITA